MPPLLLFVLAFNASMQLHMLKGKGVSLYVRVPLSGCSRVSARVSARQLAGISRTRRVRVRKLLGLSAIRRQYAHRATSAPTAAGPGLPHAADRHGLFAWQVSFLQHFSRNSVLHVAYGRDRGGCRRGCQHGDGFHAPNLPDGWKSLRAARRQAYRGVRPRRKPYAPSEQLRWFLPHHGYRAQERCRPA